MRYKIYLTILVTIHLSSAIKSQNYCEYVPVLYEDGVVIHNQSYLSVRDTLPRTYIFTNKNDCPCYHERIEIFLKLGKKAIMYFPINNWEYEKSSFDISEEIMKIKKRMYKEKKIRDYSLLIHPFRLNLKKNNCKTVANFEILFKR
ncbi:MAG: hypothetical protein NZ529_06565 [Cytophagaceae bacterium]|nr:hypothetical protein [Cytophagaceae bacterium]MDW8456442.1 hypothetical protein [Cytophagaceae bacterium]